ncbi:MAG: hypothetical protein ACLTBR_03510 [Anaerostipes sp.]|uniref:hypothetical protein n=1 Tax=Anaerostipes sp. TaxID=1872530 RepID=UPI003991B852
MKKIGKQYKTENELIDEYGDSIIPITYIPQVIFYIVHGVQPEYVLPNRNNKNHATFWFMKDKTFDLKKMWDATKDDKRKKRN